MCDMTGHGTVIHLPEKVRAYFLLFSAVFSTHRVDKKWPNMSVGTDSTNTTPPIFSKVVHISMVILRAFYLIEYILVNFDFSCS